MFTQSLIDLESDDLSPINELCRKRLGKKVSPATLWRWRQKGVRGVKLEAVYIAGKWQTTVAAFAAFIAATTAAATPPSDKQPTERSAATTRRLKSRGLL